MTRACCQELAVWRPGQCSHGHVRGLECCHGCCGGTRLPYPAAQTASGLRWQLHACSPPQTSQMADLAHSQHGRAQPDCRCRQNAHGCLADHSTATKSVVDDRAGAPAIARFDGDGPQADAGSTANSQHATVAGSPRQCRDLHVPASLSHRFKSLCNGRLCGLATRCAADTSSKVHCIRCSRTLRSHTLHCAAALPKCTRAGQAGT